MALKLDGLSQENAEYRRLDIEIADKTYSYDVKRVTEYDYVQIITDARGYRGGEAEGMHGIYLLAQIYDDMKPASKDTPDIRTFTKIHEITGEKLDSLNEHLIKYATLNRADFRAFAK